MQKGAIAYPFFKDEERTDWLIHSLKKMKKHWLSFYPYPVFIFHHAELEQGIKHKISQEIPETDIRFVSTNMVKKQKANEFCDTVSPCGLRTWDINDCSAYRWKSGLCYTEPVLAKYDWLCIIDTDAFIASDVGEDPFQYMSRNNKLYGYRALSYDDPALIHNLYHTLQNYLTEYNVEPKNIYGEKTKPYDYCIPQSYGQWPQCPITYYTNIDFISLDFARSEEYQSLFKYLDDTDGFYDYRWGDCPVRYLIVRTFVDEQQIHRFEDWEYVHGQTVFQIPHQSNVDSSPSQN
tara:strand:+ start:7490 stop:8365 length:876 start_codon:yes stop_codon:yes gene_type:complete